MLKLVIGGASSGKSDYAERLILKDHGEYVKEGNESELVYLATMMAWDGESVKRIKRHRNQRKDLGFHTVEQGYEIERISGSLSKESAVLIEDIPNLVANEMFCAHKRRSEEEVINGILSLELFSYEIVAVTGNLFSDGNIYEKETDRYLRFLARVNYELAKRSEAVFEVVCGVSYRIK